MTDATVWVTGRVHGDSWSLQGVFDSKEKAIAACRDETYFVGPCPFNVNLPHEDEHWDIVFPLKG